MSAAVPVGAPAEAPGIDRLLDILQRGDVAVLTGAGLSTESGIPDYRGASGAARRHTPMTYQAFVRDERARHRYWARSFLGWPQIAGARPNAGHLGVAHLQRVGALSAIITQNVDGLHQTGGAGSVIELHGGLDRTVCLCCGQRTSRAAIDEVLRSLNPHFVAGIEQVNPDGDVDIDDAALDSFVMMDCPDCGSGPIKPDVVFFGETVPRERVDASFAAVDAADALLVLGSSLTVMSGYRFVLHAAKLGIPIAIVNQGATRGDGVAEVRIDAPLGPTLTHVVERLGLAGMADSAVRTTESGRSAAGR